MLTARLPVAVDPGLAQVNICTESLRVVDVKIQIVSIGQHDELATCSCTTSSIR